MARTRIKILDSERLECYSLDNTYQSYFSVNSSGEHVLVSPSGARFSHLTNTPTFLIKNNASDVTIGTTSAHSLILQGGGATGLTINSSGNVSITGTLAVSSTINSQTISLAASFTGSLAVATSFSVGTTSVFTGNITASSNIFLSNGSAANPSLALTNSTTTGLYRAGTDILGVSAAATSISTISTAGIVIVNPARLSLGTSNLSRIGIYNRQTFTDTTTSVFFFRNDCIVNGSNNQTYGIYNIITVGDTYTIAAVYGVFIDNPTLTGTAAITTNYGLYIGNQTSGGTNWSIYSNGGSSYHSGSIGFGTATITGKINLAAATTAAGGIYFGTDTTLYRSAADILKTDDSFTVGTNLVVSGTSNLTGAITASSTINSQTISATASFTGSLAVATSFSVGTTSVFTGAITASSTINGQTISSAASLTGSLAVATSFSVGTTSVFTGAITASSTINSQTISSTASFTGTMAIATNLSIGGATASGKINLPDHTTAAGGLYIGADITLYRSAANVLKTDDSLVVTGDLTVSGAISYTDLTLSGNLRLSSVSGRIALGTTIQTQMGLNLSPTFNEFEGEFYGLYFDGTTSDDTTTLTGIYSRSSVASAKTITNAYGVYIANPIGAGSVTNNYALYIENQAKGGTLNYGIYVTGGAVHFGGTLAVTGAITASSTINSQTISATASFTGSLAVGTSFSVGTTSIFTGAITASSTINSQTISSAANFTGSLTVATILTVSGGALVSSTAGGTTGHCKVLCSPSAAGTGGLLLSQVSAYTAGTGAFKLYTTGTGGLSGSFFIAHVDQGTPDTITNRLQITAAGACSITGTLAVSSTSNFTGAITASSTINSQTISSAANFTGTLEVETAISIGPTPQARLICWLQPTVTEATNPIYSVFAQPLLGASNAEANGVYIRANVDTGFTITDYYGLRILNGQGSGAITNNYAIHIANQTKGSSLNYAIYAAGGAVHFGGTLAVTGAITASSTINSQTISSTASFTGSLAVATSFSVGTTSVFTGAITASSTINSQTINSTANFTGTVTIATRLLFGAAATTGVINLVDHTTAAGGLYIGADVTLYRSAADTLKTDDSLIVGGDLTVNGSLSYTDLTLSDDLYLSSATGSRIALGVVVADTAALALSPSFDGLVSNHTIKLNTTLSESSSSYYGILSEVSIDSTKVLDDCYNIRINNPAGSGDITNNYALYIASQTKGSTNYAIYAAGGQSHHAGNFGIGSATTPSYQLHISAAASPSLVVEDTTNTVRCFSQATDTEAIVGSLSNHVFSFYTNNTKRASISTGGTFQVGTATNDYLTVVSTGLTTISSASSSIVNSLTLSNLNSGADYGASILFRLGDGSTLYSGGSFNISQEVAWTSTATTRDSTFVLKLSQDGALNDKIKVASSGTFYIVMPRPVGLGASANIGSGSIADGTYYYVITATDLLSGETIKSDEVSVNITSGANEVILTWTKHTGATKIRIYRSTSAGLYGATSYITEVSGLLTTYTDTAASPSSGSPPSSNAGYISRVNVNGTTYFTGGSVVLGNLTLSPSTTTGFTYIPSISGSPSATPETRGQTVPLCFETGANILWAYSQGGWVSTTLS